MSEQQEKKTITIYDIASEAGVSPATVSRVLTNNANVRKEKRDKVLEIIEKYHFVPNAMAKGLSDTKTKLIGFITADVRNPFYSAVYVACENAARDRGYKVLLANSLGVKEREIEELNMLIQQKVDAIIQLGGSVDALETDEKYAKLAKKITETIPMVVNGKIDGVPAKIVRIDAKEGCSLLTEHLIQMGHKKIGLVGGRLNVVSTYEKYITYRETLKNHGIEYREEYVACGGYDQPSGYDGVKKLLGLKEIPTAVIAINDFAAAGVIRGITEMGFRVPEDISVVSYDNTYIVDLVTPKLTSIDYDYEAFGIKLVESAIKASNGEDVPSIQTVRPHLVVRKSSGAARK